MRIVPALAALTALAAFVPAPSACAQAARAPQRVGNFNVVAQKDPIDDRDRTGVVVVADRPPYMPVTLVWKCNGGDSYDLWIQGIPYTQERSLRVTWRFDQKAPETGEWELAQPDWLAVTDADGFTDQVEAGHTVVVRITTASGEQQTSTFQLNGAAEAFKRVSCLMPADAPASGSH